MLRNLAACLVLAGALVGCNCSESGGVKISEHRQRLTLTDEPAGALGVLDARELLAQGQRELVLVGRIGGAKPVFDGSHASFYLIDPAGAEHGHHDCGDDCPFCAKGESDDSALAVIHCVDAQGQPLKVTADKLLGLSEGQTAVIRGQAMIDEFGNLVVLADGVYVRG